MDLHGGKVASSFSRKCANFGNEILRRNSVLDRTGFATLDAACECTYEFLPRRKDSLVKMFRKNSRCRTEFGHGRRISDRVPRRSSNINHCTSIKNDYLTRFFGEPKVQF